jgi:hypothetical protein
MAQYTKRDDGGRPAGSVAGDIQADTRSKTGGWGNLWLIPLVAVIAIGQIINVPPFRTFEIAQQSDPINQDQPVLDYVLIAVHIVTGLVALVTVCLAVWPWLRVRHPAVHRWSYRLYIFSSMPCALLILPIVYLHTDLPNPLGSYAKGTFWCVCSLISYIGSRQGDAAKQRRWLLYSFAVCASVLWSQFVGMFILNTPEQFAHLMEVVGWADPLINLLFVKWWLHHTERRAAAARLSAARVAEPAYREAA